MKFLDIEEINYRIAQAKVELYRLQREEKNAQDIQRIQRDKQQLNRNIQYLESLKGPRK